MDEIWDLIESFSEGFPRYSTVYKGSITVSYGVRTVSVRFLYGFTTVYGGTTVHKKLLLLFYVHGKHIRSCRDGRLP